MPSSRPRDWGEFARLTEESSPWPRLVAAADGFEHPGDALDVGAGAGRDTRYLLSRGWRVTALDGSPEAAATLRRLPDQQYLVIVSGSIEDFVPGVYDLVNAQNSLPFVAAAIVDDTVRRLRDSVRPGGIFTATFFGPHDEWNIPGSDMSFRDAGQVRALFVGWEMVELDDDEKDGRTVSGTPKHWHVIHIVARRPGGGAWPEEIAVV